MAAYDGLPFGIWLHTMKACRCILHQVIVAGAPFTLWKSKFSSLKPRQKPVESTPSLIQRWPCFFFYCRIWFIWFILGFIFSVLFLMVFLCPLCRGQSSSPTSSQTTILSTRCGKCSMILSRVWQLPCASLWEDLKGLRVTYHDLPKIYLFY